MIEEWKDIKGYEGLYRISNTGMIKSYDKTTNNRIHPSRIISQTTNQSGYKRSNLNHPITKKKSPFIHKLVAYHFIDNPNNRRVVNHIDGDKQNNHVGNLEWCTHQENTIHAFKTGLIKKGGDRANSKLVIDLNAGVFYYTITEVAQLYNIDHTTLYHKLTGKRRNNTPFTFA